MPGAGEGVGAAPGAGDGAGAVGAGEGLGLGTGVCVGAGIEPGAGVGTGPVGAGVGPISATGGPESALPPPQAASTADISADSPATRPSLPCSGKVNGSGGAAEVAMDSVEFGGLALVADASSHAAVSSLTSWLMFSILQDWSCCRFSGQREPDDGRPRYQRLLRHLHRFFRQKIRKHKLLCAYTEENGKNVKN